MKNAAAAVINTDTGRRKAKPQSAGAVQLTQHSTAQHSTAQPLTDAGFPSYSLIISRGRGNKSCLNVSTPSCLFNNSN